MYREPKRFIAIIICTVLALVGLSACANTDTPAAIEAVFSPSGGATDTIVRVIKEAKQSIRVAAYSFTSRPVAKALVDARKHGIDVKVVLDKSQDNERSLAGFMQDNGVSTRINRHYAEMHDKFLIIDGKTVETGSFNYSANAEYRNAENVIVIRNNKALANEYVENWEKLWGESEEYAD